MKLKEQMERRIRLQGKSHKTFTTYWGWCVRFFKFVKQRDGQWRHPKDLGKGDVEEWLTALANEEWVSANTQNVALQSLCYLYREVLKQPLKDVSALRSKRPQRVRAVLSVDELVEVFDELHGMEKLVAQLIYGCGLRIGDVVGLRVKDVSFDRRQLHIFDGKGKKDRLTQFPAVLHESVRRQLESSKRLWQEDKRLNRPGVSLPGAWARKSSSSRMDFAWWYVFPSENYSVCPRTKLRLRHHRDPGHLSRCIRDAARRAGIDKRITAHNLRHCFATHAVEQGMSMVTLQKLLGHTDIRTTELYVHVSKDAATASDSPVNELLARQLRQGGKRTSLRVKTA